MKIPNTVSGPRLSQQDKARRNPIPWVILLIISILFALFLVKPNFTILLAKQNEIIKLEQQKTKDEKIQTDLKQELERLKIKFNQEAEKAKSAEKERFPEKINYKLITRTFELFKIEYNNISKELENNSNEIDENENKNEIKKKLKQKKVSELTNILNDFTTVPTFFKLNSINFGKMKQVEEPNTGGKKEKNNYLETPVSISFITDKQGLEEFIYLLQNGQISNRLYYTGQIKIQKEIKDDENENESGNLVHFTALEQLLPRAHIDSIKLNKEKAKKDSNLPTRYSVKLNIRFFSHGNLK